MSNTTTSPKVRLSGLALTGLLLGLAAPFTLVTGPLALYFGYRGLYAVNTSDGRLLGRGPAIAGMVLGGVVSVAGLLGVFALTMNRLRTANDLVECANHLRVIGLAVNQYEETHAHIYPRAVVPLEGQPPEKHASWLAALLPYLEINPNTETKWRRLAGRLDLTKPWDDPANQEALKTFVPFYQCPGYPDYDPAHNPGISTYVGIAGIGEDAAYLPKDHVCAGFFGYYRDLGLEDIRAGVGASNKMMVLETTRHNGPWIAGGQPTVRGVSFDPTFLNEQGTTLVGLLAPPHGNYGVPLIAALLVPRPEELSLIGPGRPFGGLHRGGVNVLWVDGSVRFVSDTMPPRTLRMQATLSGNANVIADLP
jgi:prepilin-type processing-associated H-X9-DG protein